MNFVDRSAVRSRLEGKRIAIVGGGPGANDNAQGFIDGHDIVVRINNYRLTENTGRRCDVFYSYFGNAIRKTVDELKRDGVTLCMSKVPNAFCIESPWHRQHNKMHGVDFRWIYEKRASWWFCDTFVPDVPEFLETFEMLGRHIPTTGFSAVLDVLDAQPKSVTLTGFDFFASRVHNLNEPWREKNTNDPIGHVPEREFAWLKQNQKAFPLTFDPALSAALRERDGLAA